MTLATYHKKDLVAFLQVKRSKFGLFCKKHHFLKKLVSNFFSILAWTFPMMVLINYPSEGHFSRSEWSKFATFLQSWHILSIYSKSVRELFLYFGMKLPPGWWQWTGKRRIWLNRSKGHYQDQKGQVWLIFTYFSILVRSIEVLPKCIASCSFSEVILLLFSNFNGVDWF